MGNMCSADKAIDGDSYTYSLTKSSMFNWWSVTFGYTVKIEKILITTSRYALQQGYGNRFKVETKLANDEHWQVCKGEHSILTIHHEVKCEKPTIASYLRLSASGARSRVYMSDVKVARTPVDTGKI